MKRYPLPIIKEIQIENYDLYKCPVSINFSSKLNIFLGTNGMGKTTFLSIVQYSIIGPYNDAMKQRNYKGETKKKRPMLSTNFFRNRMINISDEAKVIVKFALGNDSYEVCHSLYKNKLIYFKINQSFVDGTPMEYENYENLYWKNKFDMISDTLLKKYHDSLIKSCGMPDINAFIMMLTSIMFFTEARKFIFWDDETSKLLMSKYFMDAEKYHEYEEIQSKIKMLDSKMRLKSYEMSMLRRFINRDNIEKEIEEISNNRKNKQNNLNDLSRVNEEINILQEEQTNYLDNLEKLNKKIISEKIKYNNINNKINELDDLWYSNIFPNDYKEKYTKYAPLMIDSICPFCGKMHNFNVRVENCILCDNRIETKADINLENIDFEIKNYNNKKSQLLSNLKNLEKEKQILENKIANIDNEIADKNIQKTRISNALGNVDDTNIIKYLQYQKEKEQLNADLVLAKDEEIVQRKNLDEKIIEVFQDYKEFFYLYSKSFFGYDKEINLQLVSNRENSLFNFELDGHLRESDLELSESQRIFLDLSYRFSILSFFHTSGFFLCETPDSTLDVIFEKNAVKTFSNFIESGNSLYFSANARSSTLISSLIEKYKEDVKIINLFNISRNGNVNDPILKELPIYKYIREDD